MCLGGCLRGGQGPVGGADAAGGADVRAGGCLMQAACGEAAARCHGRAPRSPALGRHAAGCPRQTAARRPGARARAHSCPPACLPAAPQVIRPALLAEGFELVRREGLEVTDDVSIIEALGKPVRITPGSYTNIKAGRGGRGGGGQRRACCC